MATRVEVVEAIERLWDRYPEWRLGQLITNVAIFSRGEEGKDQVWEVENDEIITVIHRHLESNG